MKEQRKLAAIMFTDIVGYSATMSKDEKLALSILEKNRSIHKSVISKFNGQYIKEIGTGNLSIMSDEELEKFNHPNLFGKQSYGRSLIAALLNEPEKAVSLLNESFAQGNRFGIYIHQIIDFEALRDYDLPARNALRSGNR
jgi:class 3 adenylate cyclase